MAFYTTLPISVEPVEGESATSLASRLAKRNGAPRLITFCSDMGVSHRDLTNGDQTEIEHIAALAGHEPERLLFWTPQHRSPGWFNLGRERIKFTAFARTHTRGCPLCLQEYAASGADIHLAHRGLWQLSSIRTCALHGCTLVPLPAAPSNKDIFDFARLAERHVETSISRAPENATALERYLGSRIIAGPGKSWIDSLPFHVAAQTADNLGILLTLGPDAKRSAISDLQWAAAGAAGFQALTMGPDGLRQALAEMKRGHVNDAGRYLSRYRFFFDWLRYRDDDRDFDGMRDLVREFIWQNFPVAEKAKVLGKACPRQFVHSISTAVTKTGITKRQLGRRLCAMGLAYPNGDDLGFGIHDYISDEVVMKIASEFSGVLNATEAAAFLGIKRFLLTQLTKPNLITTFVRDDKALPLYHTSVLTAFMSELENLRERGTPEDGWLEIASAAHRAKITTERAVSLILLHKLPLRCYRSEIAGFRDLLVDVATLREAIGLPETGAVHPVRAGKLLGIAISTVTAMQRHQHLDSVLVARPAPATPVRYVCPASIEDFSLKYITKKQAVQQLSGEHDAVVIKMLLDEYRIDLGKVAEPIYSNAVLYAL